MKKIIALGAVVGISIVLCVGLMFGKSPKIQKVMDSKNKTSCCNGKGEKLGGPLKDFTFNVSSDFTAIESSVPVDIVFTQGSGFKMTARLPQKFYDLLETSVSGGTLTLTLPGRNYCFDDDLFKKEKPTIYITNSSLSGVTISGSGDVKINGTLKADNGFNFTVSGSGDLEANKIVSPKDVKIQVSGAGDCEIDALEASNFSAMISGAGDLECKNAKLSNCEIRITGAGDADIEGTSKTVDFFVSGAGSIDAKKLKATRGSAHVSGVGSISCNVDDLSQHVSGIGAISNK